MPDPSPKSTADAELLAAAAVALNRHSDLLRELELEDEVARVDQPAALTADSPQPTEPDTRPPNDAGATTREPHEPRQRHAIQPIGGGSARSRWRRWGTLAAAAVLLLAVGLWYRARGSGDALDDPETLIAMIDARPPASGDALGPARA